mgnify:CR=1 FL=1
MTIMNDSQPNYMNGGQPNYMNGSQQPYNPSPYQPPVKKNNNSTLLGVIIGLAIALAAGIGFMMYSNHKRQEAELAFLKEQHRQDSIAPRLSQRRRLKLMRQKQKQTRQKQKQPYMKLKLSNMPPPLAPILDVWRATNTPFISPRTATHSLVPAAGRETATIPNSMARYTAVLSKSKNIIMTTGAAQCKAPYPENILLVLSPTPKELLMPSLSPDKTWLKKCRLL